MVVAWPVTTTTDPMTILSLLWVSAHLSLRCKGAYLHLDAAPYPAREHYTRMRPAVHDLTVALGCPPAPYEGK